MSSPSEPTFEVHPYSLDTLIKLTASLSRQNTRADIQAKSHPEYLNHYFEHVGVKTIVAERRYVDRDYLEDFAAYYVRCFQPYDRYCARLHFFSKPFGRRKFENLLSADPNSAPMIALRASYVGFIVIKPLPQTVFGRTCLRTYEPIPNRFFPVTRRYSANLFGIAMDIPDTLPFQEQDSVVAACATSALWSALQATAKEFQHALWTPIEITRAATELSPAESRMIPNRGGLSAAMMADAIRAVGLEPLLLDIPEDDDQTLRSALYAYLRGRIPIIMGVSLIDVSSPRKPINLGEHAVAVTGYHLTGQSGARARHTGFRQKATTIDKIYVHDDQLGPFARMQFDGVRVRQRVNRRRTINAHSLSTTWKSRDKTLRVRAIPRILLVPLYHKVRIPYADIFQAVIEFDGFLKTLRLPQPHRIYDLEWDLHLTTVNELKENLQSSAALAGEERVKWLTKPMPRFIWRATARLKHELSMDILFDATDIHTSDGVYGVVFYKPNIAKLLTLISQSRGLASLPDIGLGALRILKAISAKG